MTPKVNDIVAVGVGIGRIVAIKGDMADVAYLHQLEGEPAGLSFPLADLDYITMAKPLLTAQDLVKEGYFFKSIEERDKELKRLREANVKRVASKGKSKQSIADKKMAQMLKELTPAQIKELFV